MDSQTQQETLLKEVMLRHGIALGKDDPIMIMHTINLLLMNDTAAAQQKLVERFKVDMEELAHVWDQNARNKAERILNAALAASRDAMTSDMKETAQHISTDIRSAVDQALGQHVRQASRAAYLNIVASIVTLGSAMIVLWVAL